MRNTSRTSILESDVVAAWQEQIAAARQRPGLLPELTRRSDELLPRFAAYYTYLKALPHRVRKALQRQWRMPLAGVALMLALGQSPGLAATIPVGGNCTLVDAITAANTDSATGGCPAGSGADTIVLPAGSTQTLTQVNNSTYGATGLPVISSTITIEGHGSTIVRAASAPEFRIAAVNSTGDLTLNETTVTGGRGVPGEVFPYGFGGGVANYGRTLTLFNAVISENFGNAGGGLMNEGGALTISNTILSGNTARYGGAIIYNRCCFPPPLPGRIAIMNSTIAHNNGSGIVSSGGDLTITDSTVANNSETVQVDFVIGLQTSAPFTFFVDLFGEPVASASLSSRHSRG
jgi:hypothetical protein